MNKKRNEMIKKYQQKRMSPGSGRSAHCAGTGGGPAPVSASDVHTKLVEGNGDEAVEGVIGGLDTSAVKRPTKKPQPSVMPPKKRIRLDKSQQQIGEMLAQPAGNFGHREPDVLEADEGQCGSGADRRRT